MGNEDDRQNYPIRRRNNEWMNCDYGYEHTIGGTQYTFIEDCYNKEICHNLEQQLLCKHNPRNPGESSMCMDGLTPA